MTEVKYNFQTSQRSAVENKGESNALVFWLDVQSDVKGSAWTDGMPKLFFMKANTMLRKDYDELLAVLTSVNSAAPYVLTAKRQGDGSFRYFVGKTEIYSTVLPTFIFMGQGGDAKSDANTLRLERFDDMNISSITSTGKISVSKLRINRITYVAPEDVKIIRMDNWTQGTDREYYLFARDTVMHGLSSNNYYAYIPAHGDYPIMLARAIYRDPGGFSIPTFIVEFLPITASDAKIAEFIKDRTNVGPTLEGAEMGFTKGTWEPPKPPKVYEFIDALDRQEIIPGQFVQSGFGDGGPIRPATRNVPSGAVAYTRGLYDRNNPNDKSYMIYYPTNPLEGKSPVLVRFNKARIGPTGSYAWVASQREILRLDNSTVADVDEFLRGYVPYDTATRLWQDQYEKDNNIE